MHADIASWLVRAKVSPPKLPASACIREALLRRLAAEPDNRIVVLDAPAGFGKTLLLSQLLELYRDRGSAVAWLSLDETDEPEVLVPYLAYAFHSGGVDMLPTGLLSTPFNGSRMAYGLGRLLQAVETAGSNCLLVLDDAERLREDAIAEVMEPLLRLQPGNLRIAIACRRNPGISLSQFSVRGELVTLVPNDLRFSRAEIAAWFGERADEKLLDVLLERTDGWPVALQLLRLGSAAAAPAEADAFRFTPTSRESAAYIREQLLARLESGDMDCLRETSVLETVRADAADHVRGVADSQRAIQRLHGRLEGIFSALEEEGAYRLHPLIREYLLEEQREHYPDRFRELHLRAADWLASRGQGLAAMRHALQGGAPELAATVFEQMGGARLWLREGMGRLNTALALLEPYALDGFPRVAIARSLSFAKSGDMRLAREALTRARDASRGFTQDRSGGDPQAVLIDGHYIDLLLTEYGCAPTADALADETWETVLEHVRGDPVLHAYIMTWRCLINVQSGRFEEAIRYGRKALHDFERSGSRYGVLFIHLHFGMVELARGRTGRALEEYARAASIQRRDVPGDSGVRTICHIAMGEAYWERGDLGNARKYLRQVVKQVRHSEAWFDLYMAAYACGVDYLRHELGIAAARAYLDAAREHAGVQGLERLEHFLDALYLRLLYDDGRGQDARAYLGRHARLLDPERLPDPQLTWRELEMFTLARARAALLDGRDDLAERQVEALAMAGEATGNARLCLQAGIERALLALDRDDRDGALATLYQALRAACEGRYLRPFLQARERLASLVPALCARVAAERGDDEDLRSFVDELARRMQGEQREQAPEGFSPRELEIIGELSRGQPDKVIARAVGISAHGVRYHLKKIYSKLGVRNRTQAVSRARQRGLLR